MKLSSLKVCLLLSLLCHAVGFVVVEHLIHESALRPAALPVQPSVVTFVIDPATAISSPMPSEPAKKKLDKQFMKLFAVDDFVASKKLAVPPEIKTAKNKNELGALSRGETLAVNRTPPSAAPASNNVVVVAKISRVFATANVKPDYLRNPKPDYPLSARRRHEEGIVQLRVHVTARGRPDRIELLQSSGFGVLDDAAITAVREWEFTPAQMGEAEVESEIDFPIQFKLE